MFALPLYVYSLLAVVGVALLACAYVAGRLEAREPLGGSFLASIASRSVMLIVGVVLLLAAVAQLLVASVEGLFVSLGS